MEDYQCICKGGSGSRVNFTSQSDSFGVFCSVCEMSRCDNTTGLTSSRSMQNLPTDNMEERCTCRTRLSGVSPRLRQTDTPHCSPVKNMFRIPSQRSFFKKLRFFSRISAEFVKTFVLNKKTIFLLVILLDLLLVGGSPAHRVRHRHLRQVLRSDQLCDRPGVMDKPTHDECGKPRLRRDINAMSLKEGQDTSLCPYTVCVDEDPTRRPVHIHRVICMQSGCRCTQEGSYRCTQLYNKMEVWYGGNKTQLEVEYGCVCAAKHGVPVEPFVPNTGD